MPTPPARPRPAEVWTVFGRWRRRSPAARRLGVALLVLALLLTLIWARTPRDPPDDAAARAPASVTVAAPPHAAA
jgi:hypothetical protein